MAILQLHTKFDIENNDIIDDYKIVVLIEYWAFITTSIKKVYTNLIHSLLEKKDF